MLHLDRRALTLVSSPLSTSSTPSSLAPTSSSISSSLTRSKPPSSKLSSVNLASSIGPITEVWNAAVLGHKGDVQQGQKKISFYWVGGKPIGLFPEVLRFFGYLQAGSWGFAPNLLVLHFQISLLLSYLMNYQEADYSKEKPDSACGVDWSALQLYRAASEEVTVCSKYQKWTRTSAEVGSLRHICMVIVAGVSWDVWIAFSCVALIL